MTQYTVTVVFETDDAPAVHNIESDVASMIANAVPSIDVIAARVVSDDGSIVNLIDVAEEQRAGGIDPSPQTQQEEAVEETQTESETQEPSADSLPTGREF